MSAQTVDQLRALLTPRAQLPAKPKRLVLHWTQGPAEPDADDLKAYHFVVNQRTLEVVKCHHDVAANMKKIQPGDDYAQHTHGINSFSIGLSFCGMLDAAPGRHFGPCPLTKDQVLQGIAFAACVCDEYDIDPRDYKQVFTHYEAQTLLSIPQNHKWDITELQFHPELGPDAVGPWLRAQIADALAALPERLTTETRMAQMNAAKNANLEDWKKMVLQEAIDAVVAAAQVVPEYPLALRPVAVAQFLLESNWGQAGMGQAHNYFGIKAKPGEPFVTKTTHEVVHGQTVTVNAEFRAFPSMEACFEAHGRLLATAGAYAKARACTDPNAFADALTGVYATDPQYGTKLKAIMRDRGLLETFGYGVAS